MDAADPDFEPLLSDDAPGGMDTELAPENDDASGLTFLDLEPPSDDTPESIENSICGSSEVSKIQCGSIQVRKTDH